MERASGSVVEALGCLLPGLVLDVPRSARLAFRLKPFERRPRSCRRAPEPRAPPALARLGGGAFDAPGSLESSCLSAAKRSATAASILSSFSPVLKDSLLALARTFVPSTAIAARLISPSAISAVTLCVSSRSRTLRAARPGSRRARDSSAARRPPATDRRRRFARAAPVRAPTPRPSSVA